MSQSIATCQTDRKAGGFSQKTEGYQGPPRVLITVSKGAASFHTVGSVEVCVIDFDCVRDGDFQEMPLEFEATFPKQAQYLHDQIANAGAWKENS